MFCFVEGLLCLFVRELLPAVVTKLSLDLDESDDDFFGFDDEFRFGLVDVLLEVVVQESVGFLSAALYFPVGHSEVE